MFGWQGRAGRSEADEEEAPTYGCGAGHERAHVPPRYRYFGGVRACGKLRLASA